MFSACEYPHNLSQIKDTLMYAVDGCSSEVTFNLASAPWKHKTMILYHILKCKTVELKEHVLSFSHMSVWASQQIIALLKWDSITDSFCQISAFVTVTAYYIFERNSDLKTSAGGKLVPWQLLGNSLFILVTLSCEGLPGAISTDCLSVNYLSERAIVTFFFFTPCEDKKGQCVSQCFST